MAASSAPPGPASSGHAKPTGFVDHQVAGIAILLWATDPSHPERLATPFFHAAAAAAMDIPVEIYFSAASVKLLEPGVAETLRPNPRHSKSALESIREAVQHGARLFACGDALNAHGLADASLIPECRDRGGAVQFMARAADQRWRALVF
jgi:predicted peroxiredoxin